MPREHLYFVYILASRSRNTYIGVTNDLNRRIQQHREGKPGSFTTKYNIHRLVYFERYPDIRTAIAREKTLKHCLRAQKLALIASINPTWNDLYVPPRTPPLGLRCHPSAQREDLL